METTPSQNKSHPTGQHANAHGGRNITVLLVQAMAGSKKRGTGVLLL
jgi:hypothetical protein